MSNGIEQARLVLSAMTGRSRSRAAVLIGGLLAVAVAASVAASNVQAEGLFDVFQSMFNTGQAQSFAARPTVNKLTYAKARPARKWRTALHPGPTKAKPAVQKVAARPANTSRQSVCVRLCDGYAFPLAAPYKGAKIETQEAACAATCPGAETALYLGASSADGIATATAARDGRSYSSLPTALAYTRTVSNSCTCGAPKSASGDLMAVLRDMTLRRGDAVMTRAGFRIFAGLNDGPHKPTDFRPLARSREIGNKLRGTLQKLEVASLAASSRDAFVALDAPPQRLSETRVPGFQALN